MAFQGAEVATADCWLSQKILVRGVVDRTSLNGETAGAFTAATSHAVQVSCQLCTADRCVLGRKVPSAKPSMMR